MNLLKIIILPAVFILGLECGITPIEYDDTYLDGALIQDTSLTDPTFQLSSHPEIDTFDRAGSASEVFFDKAGGKTNSIKYLCTAVGLVS